MRGIIVNRMKGPELSRDSLEALEAYDRSLGFPPNANLNADGTPSATDPAAAKRGYGVFVRAGCQACICRQLTIRKISRTENSRYPRCESPPSPRLYFHDDRFSTIEQAVRFMWEYLQKSGTEKLSKDDLRDLAKFLRIL
jgi:cytochrome c peroxidase